MQIKVLLLIITVSLFKSALCIHTRKHELYYSKSSNFFDNDLKSPSSDSTRTKRDITFPVLAPNQRNFVVLDIANFVKLLKVPGYSVHLLDFNDEDYQGKHEKSIHIRKSPQSLKLQSISRNVNVEKPKLDRRVLNDSGLTSFNNNIKNISENPHNGCRIESNCGNGDFKETKNIKEETTTDISEVTTTNNNFLNENSTVLSEYDDEEYGSLSDRADISPSLLASLVG